MYKSTSDSVDTGQELCVAFEEDKKIWPGGFLKCFSHVISMMGGINFHREPEIQWEIPSQSITQLNHLGAGAQGVVFSGLLNGEVVAVKKFSQKWDTDINHLRKLNHDNIVKFIGIITEESFYGLVMEFCQYGSLFQFLHSGTNLLPEQLMKWAKDIALAIAYLHSNMIIHRDLKSPNVLISDNLTVKVSDFGTSRKWKNVSTIMSFTGTVSWMAPEVIRHEPCSERMDVWSFGVLLWEMMTREMPYKHLETHAIIWGVGTDTLSLPIPTGCPNTIQVLICQCWQRIPKNRPPFKIIAAHLEMATADIIAINPGNFAARQAAWGAEVRESMARIDARNNAPSDSTSSVPDHGAEAAANPRENLRQVKEVYDQQMNRANELFMEVCALRLQLEQRERAVAEREKLLKACRCGRKNIKIQRQISSTSSDGKPISDKQLRRRKPESQLLVNYIDKEEGMTYTVAVKKGVFEFQDTVDESVRNNNVKKETLVEQNGNTMIPVQKPKAIVDNLINDSSGGEVAHV